MTRSEKLLVCVGLLVIAAVIVWETVCAPDLQVASAPQTDPTASTSSAVSRYAVDLNEATVQELAGVRGISQEMAEQIVQYRAENGRFFSVEELTRIDGIGEKTYEKLRFYVTVDP